MPVDFTGNESPAQIVKAAIEEFEQHPLGQHKDFVIFYDGSIPKMKYEFAGGPIEFSCIYRLDIMLLPFFDEAERIFDRLARPNIVDMTMREELIRYMAFMGMSAMLSNLPLHQLDVFGNNLEEVRLVVSSLFLKSMVGMMDNQKNNRVAKIASKTVKQWIEETLDALKNRRRDYLVGFMNSRMLFNIRTTAGRPPGTTKSEDKKAEEKAEFESKVENAVKPLFVSLGREPFKYEVAEALGIGGFGIDSRINSFNNRLNRLGIDYPAIIERCKPHE